MPWDSLETRVLRGFEGGTRCEDHTRACFAEDVIRRRADVSEERIGEREASSPRVPRQFLYRWRVVSYTTVSVGNSGVLPPWRTRKRRPEARFGAARLSLVAASTS